MHTQKNAHTHTHTAKGINVLFVHTTHLFKYKWDFRRNTKISSNKRCQQVYENMSYF